MKKPYRLPANRKELFFDLVKNRFFTLVSLNIMTFFFLLPAVLFIFYADNIVLAEENATSVVLTSIVWGIMIPLIGFAGLGFGGLFYTLKKLIWNEGTLAFGDFLEGIKKNGKRFFLYFVFLGVSFLLLNVASAALASSEDLHWAAKGVCLGLMILQLIFLLMLLMYVLPQEILYADRVKVIFSNAAKFLAGTFFKTVGVFLLSGFPYVPLFFDFAPIVQYIFLTIAALFSFSYAALLWTLNAHEVFDRTINRNYPEIIGKGLYPSEKKLTDDHND